jgi:signal transduction histidine kinase
VKLTWKLSVAVSVGVLILLAIHAVIRVERDVARFRDGVRRDHRNLAIAIAAAVEPLTDGRENAEVTRVISRIDRSETDMSIRWAQLDDRVTGTSTAVFPVHCAHRNGATESRVTTLGDGHDAIVTHSVVELPHVPLSVLEIVEPLVSQPEVEREAIVRTGTTTGIVLISCVTLILAFGIFFVGRPIEALRQHVIRIGRGERGVRTAIRSRDEIGELADEMNRMAQALDEATERVEREQLARFEALAQLRHADRLRAVGELASSIAHELGAPMNAVNARAHMIARGEVEMPRAKEMAARIVEEVARISHTIRQLLDHSRRESDARRVIDLMRLATGVVELVEPVARARGVAVNVRGRAMKAEVSEAQLRHVLLNLVSNALDVAPRGSTVEVVVEADDGSAAVRVIDRGPGIPEELRSRVFEPFFTTKGPGEGTGIGLAVAQSIVVEHGGRLTLERREDGATEFAVRVPRVSDG